jgi:hypothetical protein
MYYAGMHWPENAGGEHPSREYIANLPGVVNGIALICSPSARYHYELLRSKAYRVIWRAIPREGKRPAELGWDANSVADECLNLYDEQKHAGLEYFLPLNELQFPKENGGPFPGYGEMAQNLARLRVQLRRKLSQQYPQASVRLLFPAWVPTNELAHLDDWRAEAELWDGLCLHAYGSSTDIVNRYADYRAYFQDTPIVLGEWNGPNEYDTLSMLAKIELADPNFLGATYYIWETNNPGEHQLSVWGNPDRLWVFQNPPLAQPSRPPEPMPEPPTPTPPIPEEPTVPEFQFGFKAKADELGPEVVGEPLEDEQYIGDNVSMQFTTTGVMMYSKQANIVHFLAGSK